MLKIKSFLVACAVSPWFLSGFQLPVQAQLSRGTAGSTSGGGTTGSGGVGGLTNPTNPSTDDNGVVITPANQASVNSAATLVISTLTGTNAGAAVLAVASGPALSRSAVLGAIPSGALTSIATAVTSGAGTSSPIALANGGSLSISPSSPTSPASITITSANGTTTTITVASGTANPSGAIAAAAAILAAGGTQAQAQLAAVIAGSSTGINPGKGAALIGSLSGIFSGVVSSLPVSIPTASIHDSSTLLVAANVNSLRVKSLNYEKGLMIAQGKGVSVDVEKLNQSIVAYNDLIDSSTPEGVIALSKNPEFIVIGDTLRTLSASARG